MGVVTKTSPLFSLIDPIPGVGNIQPVKDKIANLNKGEVTAVSALGRNFFVRINDRVNASEPDAEQYKKELQTVSEPKKVSRSFKTGSLENARRLKF